MRHRPNWGKYIKSAFGEAYADIDLLPARSEYGRRALYRQRQTPDASQYPVSGVRLTGIVTQPVSVLSRPGERSMFCRMRRGGDAGLS
ncbi:MAG: hypothetical protein ACTXOO_00765 [Sodalis sp. (in: enterobacteria)]